MRYFVENLVRDRVWDTSQHPRPQQQQSDDGLSVVSASISELMAPEKRKTLVFGALLVSQNTIDF